MLRDEFRLIRDLLRHRPRPGEGVEVDAGDDAAVVRPHPRMSQAVTCDTMVETVHFLDRTMAPADIGWKGMAANVSDIAAMGGRPRYAVISLAAPQRWSSEKLQAIYRGLGEAAQRFGVDIVGGDTVRTPDYLVLTVTLLGEVEQGRALLRSSAQAGDRIVVTGYLGASAAGLHLLLQEHADDGAGRYPSLIQAHRRPVPQVEAGRLLLESGMAHACDDVSDGLAREAMEIAEASGVRLVLEADRIPLSPETAAYARESGINPLDWAFDGGEDFQLVSTVRAEGWETLCRQASERGLSLVPVGWVEEGTPGVDLVEKGRRKPLDRKGYNHFPVNG